MYEFAVVALTTLGLLTSGFFVVTWTPLAIRARWRGRPEVSAIALLDYAGLQIGIFALYLLATANLYRLGVQPADDDWIRVARVFTLLIFDTVVGIRCMVWFRLIRKHWSGPPDPFHGVSSPALDDDRAG